MMEPIELFAILGLIMAAAVLVFIAGLVCVVVLRWFGFGWRKERKTSEKHP